MGSSICAHALGVSGYGIRRSELRCCGESKTKCALACLLGTLGAAVIYVLSTTVIQGIVPNAELGSVDRSLRPRLRPYVQSADRQYHHGAGRDGLLLGSLLGWQFTIAQTAKSASDDRMFPSFFCEGEQHGCADHGHDRHGVVQSSWPCRRSHPRSANSSASRGISPSLRTSYPYIIALSALMVMMKERGVPEGKYRPPS